MGKGRRTTYWNYSTQTFYFISVYLNDGLDLWESINAQEHLHTIYAALEPRRRGRLWDAGILSWEDLLDNQPVILSRKKRETLTAAIEESIQHLEARNPHYFGQRLPSNQCWRLFKDFRDRIAYLDIETTGLEGEITTIALYDGISVYTYVQGQNLEQFKDDIYKYDVICTYNGKCFDVPVIESDLGIKLNQVHIDLRYVLKSVGFSGGLQGM